LGQLDMDARVRPWLIGARALRGAGIAPAGLWARRSRIQFRGVPLLSHEVFLPSTGRL
jgi:chorismate-pyruvate lyase